MWKKNNYKVQLLLHILVVSKRVNCQPACFRTAEQSSLEGFTLDPHLGVTSLSHF